MTRVYLVLCRNRAEGITSCGQLCPEQSANKIFIHNTSDLHGIRIADGVEVVKTDGFRGNPEQEDILRQIELNREEYAEIYFISVDGILYPCTRVSIDVGRITDQICIRANLRLAYGLGVVFTAKEVSFSTNRQTAWFVGAKVERSYD